MPGGASGPRKVGRFSVWTQEQRLVVLRFFILSISPNPRRTEAHGPLDKLDEYRFRQVQETHGKVGSYCGLMDSRSGNIEEHRTIVACTTRQDEYVPDVMAITQFFTQREKDDAYGIKQTSRKKPGEAHRRQGL